MKVKARVWNAEGFVADPGDQVLVDTNVWLFMHMEQATQSFTGDNVANGYMEVIDGLLEASATLKWSCFSYPEVANTIEGYCFDLFKSQSGQECSKKRYRHEMPTQRLKVVTKIQETWGAITKSGSPLGEYSVRASGLDDLTIDYRNYAVDPYDLFMIDSLKSHGLKYILTNDRDFLTVPGIEVITLHKSALVDAAGANMLMNP